MYDLDFNYKYYYNNYSNYKIEFRNELKIWSKDLKDSYKDTFKSQLIILGPTGVGKSTNTLIYFAFQEIPRLYFPIKKMMNLNNRKWRKIALYESIYVFKNKEEMEEFENKIDMMPNSLDLIEFIYLFIQFILDFYKNTKLEKKICIILDEFDLQSDASTSYLMKSRRMPIFL